MPPTKPSPNFSPDVGMMRADQTKVRQVLFNLISNAAKFAQQGTIALTVIRRTEAALDSTVSSANAKNNPPPPRDQIIFKEMGESAWNRCGQKSPL